MGGGGGKQSSKPFFFEGQKEAATEQFLPFILPRLFGQPDVGTEAAINRTGQQLTEGLSQQGLTGSGIAAKAVSDQAVFSQQQREAGIMDIFKLLISPVGQKSNSSNFNFNATPTAGKGGVGGSGFGG